MKFRILALILCCCMMLCSFGAVTTIAAAVGAETTENEKKLLSANQSVKAKDISLGLRSSIQEYGITLEDHSEIKLVPMEQDSTVNALVITTVNGTSAKVDSLISVDKEGNFQSVLTFSTQGNQNRDQGSGYILDPNSTYVHGIAEFDLYQYIYYRPNGFRVLFHAEVGESFLYARVTYNCCGFEFTYPGFVDLTVDPLEDLYDHNIHFTKGLPLLDTYYQVSGPYRSDRVLQAASGSPMCGQYFNYFLQMRIDGEVVNLDGAVRIF